MFRTKYSERLIRQSDPGSPMKEDIVATLDKDGFIQLEVVGEFSLYDEIQSHADSCDINLLYKRFVNGETDVLSRVQGMYGDFSAMPKTYADMLNSVIAGERFFDALPVEIKNQFEGSFTHWMATMQTDDWYRKMGYTPKESQVKPAEPVVKEGDQNADS